jgi:hypothetical protein
MQKILRSNTENQTRYQTDEFGAKRIEEWWGIGPGQNTRLGLKCRCGRDPDLSPSCQATAHEDAVAFLVLPSCVRLDYLPAEPFVGLDGSHWNG